MKDRERWKRIRKMLQYLAFSLLFTLILGSLGISGEIPVSQAVQKQEETEQELPTGGVDEIRIFRMGAGAAEHVPSYENQLSFFSRTTSVFEAGKGDYGFNRLSDDQKAFYMSLEISLRNFENSEDAELSEVGSGKYTPFKVEYAGKNLDDEQAGQVWTAFQSDHPGLFWLSGYMVSFDGSGEYLMPKVVDEYKNDLPRIKKIYAMIEDGILDYLDAVSGIDNTYEKVRIIYDRIIHDVDYAYQSDGTTPEAANWAHSIVGVFDPSHKSTVCEGYAKTFSFLMNILDIPNIYIVGATESDGGGRHAWNAVSFNGGGSYYYMDATWDDIGKEDPDKPENLYIYFAMPRSVFEKRHFADGPESKYWQYGLPVMEDDMKRTYFKTYGAYGTGDTDWNDQSMKEFLKQAGALSTVHGRLILLVDTDTYDKIKTSLGSFWYYSYSKEDGYKVIWAEVPQSVLVTTPAKALTLSPTEISMDMNGVSKPLSATVSISSMTQNSDDYIQVSSSDEKVVTVDAPFVKAKQDWSPASIRLTGHSVGTATIYARSALGGVAVSCKVVVKPKVSPSPSPLPTPSNPPFSGTLSNPRVNSDGVITWDCVYFGNYWQEDTNGDGKADKNDVKTPIKWRVLSVDGDDVFLLADKNLDVQQYNKNDVSVTWETCTMRSWLNGYGPEVNEPGEDFSTNNFLHNAFSENEQSAIRTTNVVNDDNPEYGTEGGNDTSDKVYLLSINEVTNPAYGFALDYKKKDEGRRAKNTEYAKTRGAYTYTDGEYAGNGYWWLRSPGNSSNSASRVDHYGYAFRYGDRVYGNFEAARAALHLNLKASSTAVSASDWLYAGTVSSDGMENEVAVPSPPPTATAMPTKAPTATETPSVSHPPVQSDLANPTVDIDGITTWDCMYFGNYWQEDTNGDGKADRNDEKNPIKWRVLSVDGDDVFLMADKILDAQRYNNTSENVTWETCTLRSWLNGTFLNNAFTATEQSAIITTNVVNDDNSEYDIEGGNNTEDQVYLLSFDEVIRPEYGFIPDTDDTKMREAVNTAYVQVGRNDSSINTENWWLRSPGQDVTMASDVGSFGGGDVSQYGSGVSIRNGVRPVLHLSLKSLSDADPVLSGLYAGIVTSEEGRIVPTVAPGEVSTPKPTAPSVGSKLRNPRIEETGITTWDCVWFGEYWKDDTNEDGKVDKEDEKKPIKWRVLSVDGNDAFLLADQNLDVQKYHDADIDVTWEKCTMRSWLNGYGAEINAEGKDYSGRGFLNDAFTAREKSAIETTYVVNNDSPYYDTEGINNTLDQVYLLSFKETMNPSYGFTADYSLYRERRKAVNTAYVAVGGEVGAKYRAGAGKTDTWFLRSPGNFGDGASFVDGNGYMFRNSSYVVRNDAAVRPALHLNLLIASDWSYAGTVSSDGKITPPSPTPTMTPAPIPVATMPAPVTAMPTVAPAVTPTRVPPVQTFMPLPTVEPSPTVTPAVTPTRVPPVQTFMPLPTVEPKATPAVTPSNSPLQKILANPRVDSGGDITWDCVYFGHYRQSDTNKDGTINERDKEEPIKWRILSVDGDDAFILADKSLDAQEYDDSGDDNITWETCSLRSWLNSTFYKKAFSDKEQSAINAVTVENKNNPEYGTLGGKNTKDNVFLLSLEDVTNAAFGFSPDFQNPSNTRVAKDTDYTKTRVMYVGKDDDGGVWWLRTPGYSSEHVIDVLYDGSVDLFGGLVWKAPNAVRPALHLNLKVSSGTASDSCWSYAGTVSSDGTENEVAAPSPDPAVTSAPTASPGIIPAATPTVNPTEEPEVTPAASLKPYETVTPDLNPTKEPTGQPLVTQNPQPIQQPAQVTSLPDPVQGVPSTVVIKSGDGEENDCDDDDFENGEEKLQRGDYFMVGNFGYKIMKLKGKKGEIAIVCVRSKKSKAYVIPGKVKKQGITFTVTSIQANAFKGCKKARKLTIKAATIRNIAKKALNGLNKRIPVKVPAKKLWIYRKMLRKFGFRIVQR